MRAWICVLLLIICSEDKKKFTRRVMIELSLLVEYARNLFFKYTSLPSYFIKSANWNRLGSGSLLQKCSVRNLDKDRK